MHGVNHIALSVGDMKRTLAFYTGTMGLRLVLDAIHAFLDMGDGRLLSFIRFKDAVASIANVTTSAHPGMPSAIGSMHHVALNVSDEATLEATKGRLQAAGVRVFGPIDHGFCTSIYLTGPDGEQVEVSCFTRPLDEREMDADTLARLDITAPELERMRRGAA